MADEPTFSNAPSSGLQVYTIRLTPGQDITDNLYKFVSDNNLKAAFLMSCVGSVTSATLRMAHATAENRNQIIELQDCYEIVSLVGTLSGGGHIHASLSDRHGNVVGGHVMGNMKVFTTAEIVIGECTALTFQRPLCSQTGFDELSVETRQQVK